MYLAIICGTKPSWTAPLFDVRSLATEKFALKSLLSRTMEVEEVHSRFIREISVAQKLNHPNVVAYHECGFDGDWLYYIMQHVTVTVHESVR